MKLNNSAWLGISAKLKRRRFEPRYPDHVDNVAVKCSFRTVKSILGTFTFTSASEAAAARRSKQTNTANSLLRCNT